MSYIKQGHYYEHPSAGVCLAEVVTEGRAYLQPTSKVHKRVETATGVVKEFDGKARGFDVSPNADLPEVNNRPYMTKDLYDEMHPPRERKGETWTANEYQFTGGHK